MDCSLLGSSVRGIFQARILESIALSISRRFSQPRDWTRVSHIVGRRFTVWATVLSILLFLCNCKWIFFSISLSDSPLLMCRNATDFYILILCHSTLLNSHITSNNFLAASLGFSIYSIHLQTVTVLFLPFWFELFLFLFPLWLLWLGLSILCWIKWWEWASYFLFVCFSDWIL